MDEVADGPAFPGMVFVANTFVANPLLEFPPTPVDAPGAV